MTAHDLQTILLSALVRAHGGQRRRWQSVIGPVRVHSLDTHAHCNWSIAPAGTASENAVVERLLDDVRVDYPIIES